MPHTLRGPEAEDGTAVRLPPRLFSPANMLGAINSDIFGDRDRPMAAAPRSRGQLAAGRGCSPKFVTAGVLKTFTAEPTAVQRFGPGVLAHSSAFEEVPRQGNTCRLGCNRGRGLHVQALASKVLPTLSLTGHTWLPPRCLLSGPKGNQRK